MPQISSRAVEGLALTVLVCLALAGCARPAPPPAADLSGRNVLIIVMDALRADHLGCYGYGRPTSPHIDRLAAEGVLFEQAYSNSSYTNESISVLFSGQLPSSNPWGAGWHARPNPDRPTLADHFQQAGYATGFFSNTPQLSFSGFFQGFDETECYAAYGHSRLAPRLVERALRFARDHRDRKTMMYLHFLDPHGPYDPPEDYYLRFTDAPLPPEERLRLFEDVRPHVPELVASGFGPGDPRFEDLVSRYDAEIAFVDTHLGQLFDGLRELGVFDNTVVVFLSDHGEEFLEHGFVEHAWRLYRESVHIPLIVRAPGAIAPQRTADPVSIADLMPTLLRLAGLERPGDAFDGAPLFAERDGAWRVTPHANPIIAELLMQTRPMQRMVYAEGFAYLAAMQWMTPAQCSAAAATQREMRQALAEGRAAPVGPWAPVEHEELYDLRADPEQRADLTGDAPAGRLEAMRAVLEAYRARCPEPVSDEEKIRAEWPAMTPEMRELIEALGYMGGGAPESGMPPEEEVVVEGEEDMDPALEERLRNLGYL